MDAKKKANGKYDLTDVDEEVAFAMAYAMEYYMRHGADRDAFAFKKASQFMIDAVDTAEIPESFFNSATTIIGEL
jgi:hypothetical protein